MVRHMCYLACPRRLMEIIAGCFVFGNRGRRLQHMRCQSPKDNYPVFKSLRRTVDRYQKTSLMHYNQEACNAVLFGNGGGRRCAQRLRERQSLAAGRGAAERAEAGEAPVGHPRRQCGDQCVREVRALAVSLGIVPRASKNKKQHDHNLFLSSAWNFLDWR
ncbi:unnamed protein product [Prorocentrum cordatum]|uniref:Uncharacterized protein n=1 Tax=Prorocentrum cordatum TaxID=2364126 RepID=A0ABN9S8N8_9DINO|nr:unnamed protein product [Polarella glacialis]